MTLEERQREMRERIEAKRSEKRKPKVKRNKPGRPIVPHGSGGFKRGCRCEICKQSKHRQNHNRYVRMHGIDGKPSLRMFAVGRKCKCGNALSRYNPGPKCFACKQSLALIAAEREMIVHGG